jgi:hypothetical protein
MRSPGSGCLSGRGSGRTAEVSMRFEHSTRTLTARSELQVHPAMLDAGVEEDVVSHRVAQALVEANCV